MDLLPLLTDNPNSRLSLLQSPAQIMEFPTEVVGEKDSNSWSPQSWRLNIIHAQAVEYRNKSHLDKVCLELEALPPLVSPAQIEDAREAFVQAAKGERFIIQGGDCAESFYDVRPEIINSKASLLTQQAALIENKLMLPVTCVGRIAGQYAKPRSKPTETLADGTAVMAFRGHNVNGVGSCERSPNPERLLHGYFHSAATLNTLSIIESQNNYAASTRPPSPTSDSGDSSPSSNTPSNLTPKQIFTSHEAFLLPYESSLTRGRYCTSAAFLWVGERTRQLNGAHVEFLRGLRNPIGVKLSASASPLELVALLDVLCPQKAAGPGRVTLITRLGAQNVKAALPPLVEAVQASGHKPLWISDPCHGNTITAKEIKTRCAVTMLEELQQTYAVHRSMGSRLGGLHMEQTGESVVECVEHIAEGTGELSLGVNYRTLCDPRLSQEQAMLFVERFTDYVRSFEAKERMHGIGLETVGFGSEKDLVDRLPFFAKELAVFA